MGQVHRTERREPGGPQGEILTLLNSMRIAAGFETATAGKVFIDGKDMTGVPPEKRPVNMVFQRHAPFPHLMFDNIAFAAAEGLFEDQNSRRWSTPSISCSWSDGRWIGGSAAARRNAWRWPAPLSTARPSCCSTNRWRHRSEDPPSDARGAQAHPYRDGTTFIYATHDQDGR